VDVDVSGPVEREGIGHGSDKLCVVLNSEAPAQSSVRTIAPAANHCKFESCPLSPQRCEAADQHGQPLQPVIVSNEQQEHVILIDLQPAPERNAMAAAGRRTET
jgi:hypothetical protein